MQLVPACPDAQHPFNTTVHGKVFPMPVSLGASWNTSLMEAIGTAIALEMRSAGFDQGLSPILQVRRSKAPLATENMLENADGVLRPHQCSLGAAPCTYALRHSFGLFCRSVVCWDAGGIVAA